MIRYIRKTEDAIDAIEEIKASRLMTDSDLEARTGIDRTTLISWRQLKRSPNLGSFLGILEALNLDLIIASEGGEDDEET